MKRSLYILITLCILLILSLSIFFLYESRTIFGRAETTPGSFSPGDSLCFYSPLQAKMIDEKILISCFFIKDDGKPASGINSAIIGSSDLVIEKIQPVSDSKGQIKAYVSSKRAGDYSITVSGNDIQLTQQLNLRFTD